MKISLSSFLSVASKKLNLKTPPSKTINNKSTISRSEAPSFASPPASSTSSDQSCLSSRLQSTTPLSVLPKTTKDIKISKRELEAVLRRLGNDDEIFEGDLATFAAHSDDDYISLRALGVGIACAGEEIMDEEELMKEAFKVFDVNGDGKISAEELLGVFVAIGDDGCTIEDCRRMIGGVDSDGDGFVCFDDFVRMMMDDG